MRPARSAPWRRRGLTGALLLTLLLSSSTTPARSAELLAEIGLEAVGTSNVFLDRSREADLWLRPQLELGVDFAEFWAAGYNGELSAYIDHGELLSHWHQAHIYANPAWGEDAEHEAVVELAVETLQNDDAYAEIDHVKPSLYAMLGLTPLDWLRAELTLEAAYRLFYDDRSSSSVDAWIGGQLALGLPSRTTLVPRIDAGIRHYTGQFKKSVSRDDLDGQLDASLRIGQGLWERAGLLLEYGYLWAIGDSGMLERKLAQAQFSFLGTEFLASGHHARLGFTQLLGESWSLRLGVGYEQRLYGGWEALEDGVPTGADRADHRLLPTASVRYQWTPDEATSLAVPEVAITLAYGYVKQWSNSTWYDTTRHTGRLSLRLAW